MSIRIVHRPARVTVPLSPPAEVPLAAPPQQGDAAVGGLPIQSMLPVLGSMSSITMMVVLRGNPVMVVVGAMVLVVALIGGVGMAFSHRGNASRTRKRERERYLDHLERTRSRLRNEHAEIRERALTLNPAPTRLGEVASNPERLWERRRHDSDFLSVRVGSGRMPWFGLTVPPEPNPVQPFDPIMTAEAHTVADSYAGVAGMPITVALRGVSQVAMVGDPVLLFPTVRAMIANLAVFQSPNDFQIGLVVPPERLASWSDVDLLPHTLTDQWDGPVPARRIAPTPAELALLIHDELSARASRFARRSWGSAGVTSQETPLLIVIDSIGGPATAFPLPEGVTAAAQLGITLLTLVGTRLHEPGDTQLRLTLVADESSTAGGVEVVVENASAPTPVVSASADALTAAQFAGLASRLAPLRLSAASRDESEEARQIDALELLGIESITQVGPDRWAPRSLQDFLRVPVAVGDDGRAVHIDLKESAHGGMGPHGICIGATGSGKSEFLRTLILSLVTTHGPEDLAVILADYKGGAAFTPFAGLPHIAGLIDNLADDPQMIQRARVSIEGEIVRRQQLLKDAGSFASITDYREARRTNPALDPMPHLFVVIDEFGELLTAEPDFIDLFLQIGRIGRALGIHLLLASQRIEGGKLRGLDSYLSYWIGLRTFSEQESAVVLETPDAFHLPPIPGYGYLKVDTTTYQRFKAAYVSAPLPATQQHLLEEDSAWGVMLQPAYNTIQSSADGGVSEVPAARSQGGPTLIDQCVSQLRGGRVRTAPVWLPPLPDRLPLFQVIDDPGRPPLSFPVGLLDDPARQEQRPWELDLGRAGGHFAIIGAPQTGRSTFLRTFAAGIATVNTPRHVTMYGLDLTGSGLARIEDFPHVGSVATRTEREQQTRLLEELAGMVAQREKLFRSHRIESLNQFRGKHAAHELPEIVSPDVVLLIDGYGLVRSEFEHLAEPLADLLTRGPSYGIHLVLAMTRWNELTMSLQPLIGNKFELRLNDPSESTLKRKLAESIRADQPGRVITDELLFAQVALPSIDEVNDDNLGEALTSLAKQAAQSWSGPGAAPIRLLPEDLDPGSLPDELDEPDALPIGLRQDTMEPALLDLEGTDQNILVLGDSGSGKSTFLRQVIAALIERHTDQELVFAVMEPRGSLVNSIPDSFLGGHANTVTKARALAAALATELERRQNEEASSEPRIILLVDDYDVLATGGNKPIDVLLPYLPSARELRFTVILTRPVAGSARALYENTIQTLKDAGGTGIILSGERAEGQLWPGIHANHAQPGRAKLVRRGQPPRLVQIANRRVDEPATATG